DRYMLSETDGLRAGVEDALAAYDFGAAYERIEAFITTLSTWYIRLTKQRLWRPGLDDDKRCAYEVFHHALSALARVAAPFLPSPAEAVGAAPGGQDGVHLADWPPPSGHRDAAISGDMAALREIVRLARGIREAHGLRHRHPVPAVAIAGARPEAIRANA